MPYVSRICEAVESFVNVSTRTTTSEQHVHWSVARDTKDQSDINELDKWFTKRNSLVNIPELLSLSSGFVGSDSVDCHKAYEVGSAISMA